MRKRIIAFSLLTLAGVSLAGCGLFRFERREAWRDQAEKACLTENQVQPSAYMSLLSKPIDGPGVCGMQHPFRVAALDGGTIGLKQKLTLACPIIPTIDGWLNDVVKPAALLYFGSPVVDLNAGSYSCRGRNNQVGARLSEHSFGNALDVMSFVLADGRIITVLKGWNGDPVERDFLREVFVGACERFTTVLGPGSDRYHSNHLHLDLARHDPRGMRRFCRPILKFDKRLDPQMVESLKAQGSQIAHSSGPGEGNAATMPQQSTVESELPFEGDLPSVATK